MWFLAPPSACTRLPLRARRFVDVPRDRRRADEADGLDVGMMQQRVHRFLVAVDDVEHAIGQSGFLEQSATSSDAEDRARTA